MAGNFDGRLERNERPQHPQELPSINCCSGGRVGSACRQSQPGEFQAVYAHRGRQHAATTGHSTERRRSSTMPAGQITRVDSTMDKVETGAVRIELDNLILRDFRPTDLAQYQQLRSDPKMHRFYNEDDSSEHRAGQLLNMFVEQADSVPRT